MPELKPTLNVGEMCLYFPQRDTDRSQGLPALVVKSNLSGILQLEVVGERTRFYRRSVWYEHDPILREQPDKGRWTTGELGGVWNYIEPAPRPARATVWIDESITQTPAPKTIIPRTPHEIDQKLRQLVEVNTPAGEAAKIMEEFTGEPWHHMKAFQRMRRVVDNTLPETEKELVA